MISVLILREELILGHKAEESYRTPKRVLIHTPTEKRTIQNLTGDASKNDSSDAKSKQQATHDRREVGVSTEPRDPTRRERGSVHEMGF